MPKVILIILICALFSCRNNNADQPNINVIVQDSTSITKADIEKLNYNEFILDEDSDKKIVGWLKYREMSDRITEIKNGDLSYFKGDKKIVETFIQEFTDTVPSNIDDEAIQARVLIVRTMYLKLNSVISMSTSSKTAIEKSIKDLLEAFSNLNFQINKKFERDAQNIVKPE